MLNLTEILSQPINKAIIMQIISEIELQPSDFQQVFDLIFDKNKNIAWRAAWITDHISRKHSKWFSNQMKVKLISFSQTDAKNGHLRLCLSILLKSGLPADISGDFVNFCFNNILEEKTAIAAKALSIKLLAEICKTEPDLRNEVEVVLRNINIENYTSGMKAVVKNFFI